MGLFNISNGYTLFSLGSAPKTVVSTIDPATMETQEIRMVQDNS